MTCHHLDRKFGTNQIEVSGTRFVDTVYLNVEDVYGEGTGGIFSVSIYCYFVEVTLE